MAIKKTSGKELEIIENDVEDIKIYDAEEVTNNDIIIDLKSGGTLEELKKEEYVDIEIPESDEYPDGTAFPICLNGVLFLIPVGILHKKGVPKPIYDIYEESRQATKKIKDKQKAMSDKTLSK